MSKKDEDTLQGPLKLSLEEDEVTDQGALTVPRSLMNLHPPIEQTPSAGTSMRKLEGRESTEVKVFPPKEVENMTDQEILGFLEGGSGSKEFLLPIEEEIGTDPENTRNIKPQNPAQLRLEAQAERQVEAEATVLDPPRVVEARVAFGMPADVADVEETCLQGPKTSLESLPVGPLRRQKNEPPIIAIGFWFLAGGLVLVLAGFILLLVR